MYDDLYAGYKVADSPKQKTKPLPSKPEANNNYDDLFQGYNIEGQPKNIAKEPAIEKAPEDTRSFGKKAIDFAYNNVVDPAIGIADAAATGVAKGTYDLANFVSGNNLEKVLPEPGRLMPNREQNIVEKGIEGLAEFAPTALGSAVAMPLKGAAALSKAARAGAVGSKLGAEGALFSATQGESPLTGAALGIAGGAVGGYAGQLVGKGVSKLKPGLKSVYQKVFGKAAPDNVIDDAGRLSPEMQAALKETGIKPEDLTDDTIQYIRSKDAVPEDVIRKSEFEELGLPSTKGDVTQDFAQKKAEAQLLETADDVGVTVRKIRTEQSEKLQQTLDEMATGLGVADEAGESVKSALSKLYKSKKKNQRELYEKLAKEADNVENIPLQIADDIDYDILDDIEIINEPAIKGLKKRLLKFGQGSPEELAEFAKKETITPLTLKNAERFRKMLNNISQGDPKMQAATRSIMEGLDNQYGVALDTLENAGRSSELGNIAKSAREATRDIKTEFSPESITGKLINKKRDGVTNIVEADNLFKQILKPNKNISTYEKLDKVIKNLDKAGSKGKKAISDLQSKTVLEMLNSAFKNTSRNIQGQPIFNAANFEKTLKGFGSKELKLLFKDKPQILRKLNTIKNVSRNMTPSQYEAVKGSGNVILDITQRLGLNRIPGLGGALEGMGQLSRVAKNRNALRNTLKNNPRRKKLAEEINKNYPEIGKAIGIASLVQANNDEGKEND